MHKRTTVDPTTGKTKLVFAPRLIFGVTAELENQNHVLGFTGLALAAARFALQIAGAWL